MIEDWGPWIEHDFSGCPFKAGDLVKVQTNQGWTDAGRITNAELAGGWKGPKRPCVITGAWIVRYCIPRRPAALLQLIEMVESLPDRQPVRAGA